MERLKQLLPVNQPSLLCHGYLTANDFSEQQQKSQSIYSLYGIDSKTETSAMGTCTLYRRVCLRVDLGSSFLPSIPGPRFFAIHFFSTIAQFFFFFFFPFLFPSHHNSSMLSSNDSTVFPVMAHPNKSSLLNRLFPQEEPPTNQFFSGEDLSSSTLFANISSPGLFSASKAPFASSSSREEQLRPSDLFRACFADFSNDTAKSKAHEEKAAKGDALEHLREAFAQEGVELYTSVVSKLAEARQEIASQISDFATMSSSMAADMDELYANLSYPLSTTLCHSKNFPRATIEVHLANVKEDLTKAESELQGLEREWQENVQKEQELRQELLDMEGNPPRSREYGYSDEDHLKKAGFKQEIEQLLSETSQELEEIEEGYKEGIQALTMKMMQAMRAD
ncbi:hypothetical protein GGI42DRAFT_105633 [Trichoderma sp. SZMC 28013]